MANPNKLKNTIKDILKFRHYLLAQWKSLAVVILLSALILPLNLVFPYVVKIIIDKTYVQGSLGSPIFLLFMGMGILILATVINAIIEYQQRKIKNKINFNLSQDFFRYLQKQPLKFFQAQSSGEYIYKISYDVERVSEFISGLIPPMIFLLPRLIFIVGIIFYLNLQLALLVFCLIIAVYLNFYFFGRKLKLISQDRIEKNQSLFKNLQESFSHISLVKAFGREDYEILKAGKFFLKKLKAEIQGAKIETLSAIFGAATSMQLVIIVISLYGGYQLVNNATTFGSLAAVMLYLSQIGELQKKGESFLRAIVINSVSCQRLVRMLDLPQKIIFTEVPKPNFIKGKIEFQNVSFCYQENGLIFKKINFVIPASSKIALVGSSGCGKTTLLNLVLGFYNLTAGKILVDGYDLGQIDLEAFKEQCGIVLQEPLLWNDTVKNNILYGKIDSTFQEVVWAANLAKADAFIKALPQGYETVIGENGYKISEGQKQRLAIARAVIKKPKILMLDEAMASLDSETEELIMENIKKELLDSTVICVSHRYSTIKNMDLVYFLQTPEKMQIATSEVLIEKNQRYQELFAAKN